MNKLPYIFAAGIVLSLALRWTDPAPGPGPVDPIDSSDLRQLIESSDAAYWSGYADFCDQMADAYPDGWNNTAVAEWNTGLSELRRDTHGAINEQRSEATENNTLKEFAAAIRGKQ